MYGVDRNAFYSSRSHRLRPAWGAVEAAGRLIEIAEGPAIADELTHPLDENDHVVLVFGWSHIERAL